MKGTRLFEQALGLEAPWVMWRRPSSTRGNLGEKQNGVRLSMRARNTAMLHRWTEADG